MKILIAINGFPRSHIMQADEYSALSPYCPFLVHFSCLNLCHTLPYPPTTAAHLPFAIHALFFPDSSPLYKPCHFLMLSFFGIFLIKPMYLQSLGQILISPQSPPRTSSHLVCLALCYKICLHLPWININYDCQTSPQNWELLKGQKFSLARPVPWQHLTQSTSQTSPPLALCWGDV